MIHIVLVENGNAEALASEFRNLLPQEHFHLPYCPYYDPTYHGLGSLGQDIAICSDIDGLPAGLSLVIVYCSIRKGENWPIHDVWVSAIVRRYKGRVLFTHMTTDKEGLHDIRETQWIRRFKWVRIAAVYEPDGYHHETADCSTDSELEDFDDPYPMREEESFLESEGYIKIYNAPPFDHGRRSRKNIKFLIKILPEVEVDVDEDDL